ncbi:MULTISPECIES: hypothetical protein [Paenibacillus]|uniref:DUF4340 domain-containing protein n=1 Tax=Paenibacillus albilobatus TaxID=2716884 RepID=A0A919XJB8_9BACL|nr:MULTISPECIES: hypothetical protein [Paenibacillus]GIO33769.1 hypothetical protein J2TS6_49100 [Paenibacillus albilobatus]
MKKVRPALVFLIVLLVVVCMAYFVRPYQTDAPGKKENRTSSPGAGQAEPVWVNKKDVITVEWDGKRTSWLLRRTSRTKDAESGWTLNGKPVAQAEADTILSQMNSLLAKGAEGKRPASSLKNKAIDSNVTVTSGPDAEEKVYLISNETADPGIFWIIPSGGSYVYPISEKDMNLLEKTIDQLKASSPPK